MWQDHEAFSDKAEKLYRMNREETKTTPPKSWELVMDLRSKAKLLNQDFEIVTLRPLKQE